MRRILVVDDDPDIRQLLRVALEWEGYDVETATDGVAALNILSQADETWIVLLDIVMPRMTGLELCARLTAIGGAAARHLVVLMTAGFFPEGDAPPPVRALLPKPFDLNAVQNLITQLAQTDPNADNDPESSASACKSRILYESSRRVA